MNLSCSPPLNEITTSFECCRSWNFKNDKKQLFFLTGYGKIFYFFNKDCFVEKREANGKFFNVTIK